MPSQNRSTALVSAFFSFLSLPLLGRVVIIIALVVRVSWPLNLRWPGEFISLIVPPLGARATKEGRSAGGCRAGRVPQGEYWQQRVEGQWPCKELFRRFAVNAIRFPSTTPQLGGLILHGWRLDCALMVL
jgi:hypothetical protein